MLQQCTASMIEYGPTLMNVSFHRGDRPKYGRWASARSAIFTSQQQWPLVTSVTARSSTSCCQME